MEPKIPEDALNMALELAFEKKIRVIYWDTNLDNFKIIRKIVCADYFRKRYSYKGILDAVCKLSDHFFNLFIFSIDDKNLIENIQEKIERYGINMMFVDYEEKDKELVSKIEKSLNIPVVGVLNTTQNP